VIIPQAQQPARATDRKTGWLSPVAARRVDRLLTLYLPLGLVLLFLLAPFYWMAITSLKPDSELYSPTGNPMLVLSPSLEHYQQLLTKTEFPTWTRNTMVIAILATTISLLLGVPAGYSLARLRFKGAGFVGLAIFVTYLVPTSLLFIPMLQVVKTLHLQDNFLSLILIYPTFLAPFCTWLMAGYFKTIPGELEECARIDGANRFTAMWRIAFPLATPGILSAGIFSFTLSWNEFIYALTFVTASSSRTIPVGVLTQLSRADFYFWGPLMAGALLGSVPVALIYSFFVEQYAAGLTAGAVKG
jgi:multiple sugar transport system permease protein